MGKGMCWPLEAENGPDSAHSQEENVDAGPIVTRN